VSAESYAGDISVQEAWKLLSDDDSAVLVDVRTRPEWVFVGIPDMSGLGRETVFCEWQSFPTMQVNGEFAAQLRAKGIAEDQPMLFLCRSGQRSKAAAGGRDSDDGTGVYPLLQRRGRFRGPARRRASSRQGGGLEGGRPALDTRIGVRIKRRRA